MNQIQLLSINELGYNFIEKEWLPADENEYYLRFQQNPKSDYRNLTEAEIDILIQNRNLSDNWNNVLVSEEFDTSLIRNCRFYGLVRIGSLSPYYKEFHSLRLPIGIYNSTIISCDIGNNVCIENVGYLSHYIIGNDVMITNINEIATTSTAKFGNGIIKDGEEEKNRVWIEVCNENGGRAIIPFLEMLPGDAFLWSRYRDDEKLQQKFKEFTQSCLDSRRGFYGMIGDRTVIKNSRTLKDVNIGTDAYIKGANKLKNLTIKSDANRKSQIGEGCELVNGIIGFGCRIFYGVKAVRFILSSHSQLKYGARLINSYLGNNSTISCCEVLNSLIFPAHEQHHNNSFLCASLINGQSNIAAGATIGSNHNSRSADGEIIAGRGFWPGLCVSLKHNSKFASFTILAKGDFPAELDVPVPFCLISNDVTNNRLMVSPAYWFRYNMYALERNTWKYKSRDRRTGKLQRIDYHYLAPDSINEIFDGLKILENVEIDNDGNGKLYGWENSKRPVFLLKINDSIQAYKDQIICYAAMALINFYQNNNFKSFEDFRKNIPSLVSRSKWINVGGQLIKEDDIHQLKYDIKNGNINSWNAIHKFYITHKENYEYEKLEHAFTSLLELNQITTKQFTKDFFIDLVNKYVSIKSKLVAGIYTSREKDYTNHFRLMVYENRAEMDKVIGRLDDNSFIQEQFLELDKLKSEMVELINNLH